MKVCLRCKAVHQSLDWTCPECGASVQFVDGFRAFAPGLASSNDGFAADGHDQLQRLQDGSFWFRARNRLIGDLARRYFHNAKSVMEVGCGTGFVLTALADALPHATLLGSEIYASGLGPARERLGNRGEVFQMDARAIPFEDEFDLICAFDVLEHVDEDIGVLREMRRALKAGGGVILSVPQHPALWSRNDDLAFHRRRYERSELQRKCADAGLDVVWSSSFVSSLLPAMAWQRLTEARRVDYDPSVEMQLPKSVDRLFEMVLDAERMVIRMGMRFPVGGSRFVVAVKDGDGR